ncbi:PMP-22/EMP/MP20/Claudin superfamily, partial [Trinorchestia longiramus]
RRSKRSAEKVMFLTPLHGGIWTMCIDLTKEQQQNLTEQGFLMSGCVNYLGPPDPTRPDKNDWIQRMQNLSISCALVTCILLASCALVGLFGILNRQISAVLVTGVMYILATIFAVFCLAIMHFKRRTKKDCANLDPQVSPYLNAARVFSTSWSLSLGWAGAVTCLGAALLWLLL